MMIKMKERYIFMFTIYDETKSFSFFLSNISKEKSPFQSKEMNANVYTFERKNKIDALFLLADSLMDPFWTTIEKELKKMEEAYWLLEKEKKKHCIHWYKHESTVFHEIFTSLLLWFEEETTLYYQSFYVFYLNRLRKEVIEDLFFHFTEESLDKEDLNEEDFSGEGLMDDDLSKEEKHAFAVMVSFFKDRLKKREDFDARLLHLLSIEKVGADEWILRDKNNNVIDRFYLASAFSVDGILEITEKNSFCMIFLVLNILSSVFHVHELRVPLEEKKEIEEWMKRNELDFSGLFPDA